MSPEQLAKVKFMAEVLPISRDEIASLTPAHAYEAGHDIGWSKGALYVLELVEKNLKVNHE